MTDTIAASEGPAPTASTPGDGGGEPRDGITYEAIAIVAFVIALAAVFLAVFAMGLATRSIDEHRSLPAGGGGGGATPVTLDEFTITPTSVDAGGSLEVENAGTTVHDLVVEGQATPELNAGESATLDLGELAPGTYDMYCQIPGHRDSGMEAELTVQ